MASEKRVDPATGEAVSFEALKATYARKYKKSEIKAYWEDECKPVKKGRKDKAGTADAKASKVDKAGKAEAKTGKEKAGKETKAEPKAKAKAKATAKALPKAKAKAKAAPKEKADVDTPAGAKAVRSGKDGGASVLAKLRSYSKCVLAEYVWLDAEQVPRSKTMTMTHRPTKVSDLRVWNYDGSSTGQADGHNSEVLLKPRAIFNDPFRGFPHVLVLADAWNAWDDQPAIGNTRAHCAEVMKRYKGLDPWFGLEQEYTLMRPGKVGEAPKVPLGFNDDGSEPAPQGPYYTGAGTGVAIGRPVADEHYAKCLEAGVKIAGINSEVMPGQWEYQIGPCRGVETGDHLTIARYIMLRVTESHGVVCSLSPKPQEGDWNGAGCHTNFSVAPMRAAGGYDVILKVCEAFGKYAKEHIAEYGEGNEKRLTGKHETCDINSFKFGVANRGASIRIPRDAEKNGRGYMEDRRPAANCDPYKVTARIIQTTGECLSEETIAAGAATHSAFVFIKPHAVYDNVKDLVKEKLGEQGITIKSEGQIKAETIDKKKLIDTHYGAIAAKAVSQKPSQLVVQEKAQEEFEKQFGVAWKKVLEDGLVYNALDGAKKLGITPDELGQKYDTLKKGVDIIKFGGGFYCGKVDGIYVINGFYMAMRSKFTQKGTSIYYYQVEWPAGKLNWADFRAKVLGGTDPATAPAESIRNLIYSKWEDLGLKAQPDTGDNGVHASASPFEALAERSNWLRASLTRDYFGKALLASGVPLKTIKEWSSDPVVEFEGGKKSLFDLLEDLNGDEVLKKAKAIVGAK
jgi:glutamine synthetase